jgi:hypothetical protein
LDDRDKLLGDVSSTREDLHLSSRYWLAAAGFEPTVDSYAAPKGNPHVRSYFLNAAPNPATVATMPHQPADGLRAHGSGMEVGWHPQGQVDSHWLAIESFVGAVLVSGVVSRGCAKVVGARRHARVINTSDEPTILLPCGHGLPAFRAVPAELDLSAGESR